jgi:hypothetical protein
MLSSVSAVSVRLFGPTGIFTAKSTCFGESFGIAFQTPSLELVIDFILSFAFRQGNEFGLADDGGMEKRARSGKSE